MHTFLTATILLLALLIPAGKADAAIYTYKDDNGRTVFVDEEHKIPARYRTNTRTITEQRDLQQVTGSEGAEPAEPPAQTVTDRESQTRARQAAERLDRDRIYKTPVMVRGNRVLVPVEISVNGSTSHLMLLLDTGATMTVLHRSATQNLPFAPGETINATVAGGRTVKSEKVVTGYLEAGPFRMKEFPVMLITPQGSGQPFDGMLGMDFLKDHPYTVDMDNEMIRWLPAER